jgi:hypothetical protein
MGDRLSQHCWQKIQAGDRFSPKDIVNGGFSGDDLEEPSLRIGRQHERQRRVCPRCFSQLANSPNSRLTPQPL